MPRTIENTPLATLPAPTAQQVFDVTWRRAHQNPVRCHQPGDGCLYRSRDGANSCFVGDFLTDEEAVGLDQREPLTATDLRDEGLMPERLVPHTSLLQRLQDVHDQTVDTKLWPQELRAVAAQFKLAVAA